LLTLKAEKFVNVHYGSLQNSANANADTNEIISVFTKIEENNFYDKPYRRAIF